VDDATSMQNLLRNFAGIEEDEHGKETGQRFLSALDELTSCRLQSDVLATADILSHFDTCIKWKDFDAGQMQDMIVINGIQFTSVCNHHVLPFIGKAHIAYVPSERMAGLSKFARVVRHFAHQAQLQERMTHQVADYLERKLQPKGVAVVLQAEHMCMTIRGAQAPGTLTTTSTMRGVFADHDRTAKAEFLSMIKDGR
jgi:GTP cyclohydrolase I